MPAARAFSVPRAARRDQTPGLSRRLRRWLARELPGLRPALEAGARAARADRYRKHFDALTHAALLVCHGLAASPSLRQSYAAFADPALLARLGLGRAGAPGVSYSHFAASNTSRPAAFLAGLVPALAARVRQLGRLPPGAVPAEVRLLDSTFIRLSLKLARWLPHGPAQAGVRVQVDYQPARDLPAHVLVADTRKNDCTGLDALLLDDPAALESLRAQTLVLDLGYYSHRRFARLLAAAVHLVSRLKDDATVTVEADCPVALPLPGVAAGRITVLAEQRITLGSPNNRRGAVLAGLRLVTARVAPSPAAARRGAEPLVYRLVTDRWDLAPAEVVQVYLWRWQIELFFRWLKRYVRLEQVLGTSRNAVELSVWLALVVHLLGVLAAHATGLGRRSPALVLHLTVALAQLVVSPEEPAPPAAQQLPLPGAWPVPPAPS
jgi:hypothetical protein